MSLNTTCTVASVTDKGPSAPKEITLCVADASGVVPGETYDLSLAAPAEPPAPPPGLPEVTVANQPDKLLEVGDAWFEDGVWGAAGLTRGTYTDLNGTGYEQYIGVSPELGPNGEVTGRVVWKFPTGTTEVKSYPAWVVGNKPGYYNSWVCPGGHDIVLTDGTVKQEYPSGKTPNSFFPLQLPLASLNARPEYQHNEEPTGRGHLTYDIWLQAVPEQVNGFGNSQITHEIMIPLDPWGGYGEYPSRNPSWYSHDATIDGRLFHVYYAPNFNGVWKWICFQPDQQIESGAQLDLAAFINYVTSQGWAAGTEYCVDVELGVEPVEGTGDLTIRHRVWKD